MRLVNSRILLVFSFIFCFLASCKKNSDKGPSGASNKLKMYIEDARATPYNSIDTFSLTYDNNNRITSLFSKTLKFTYAYTSNTGYSMDLYETGQLSIHEIGFIQGNGYVDSTFQYNNTNDSTTEKYIYNGNVLTSKITYSYSKLNTTVDNRENYTYDNNGNLTKTVQFDGSGSITSTTTYTYTDKPFQLTTSPAYYPLQGKNLPASETQTDGSGNVDATVTYTYTFDSQGRVTKETDTVAPGVYVVKTYVYY